MKTLCPTWDQTLIFDDVLLSGHVEAAATQAPSVVVEVFDWDARVMFPFSFFNVFMFSPLSLSSLFYSPFLCLFFVVVVILHLSPCLFVLFCNLHFLGWWPWKLESTKEHVAIHLPKQLAPKVVWLSNFLPIFYRWWH